MLPEEIHAAIASCFEGDIPPVCVEFADALVVRSRELCDQLQRQRLCAALDTAVLSERPESTVGASTSLSSPFDLGTPSRPPAAGHSNSPVSPLGRSVGSSFGGVSFWDGLRTTPAEQPRLSIPPKYEPVKKSSM